MESRKGFTLIELLVVVAIIGVLSSIVLASLDSSRKKGRDARRLADVKQLQLALELYYDQNNAFPTSISYLDTCGAASCAVTNLMNPGYISVVPRDPLYTTSGVPRDYSYTGYAANPGGTNPCISFHLGATLESAGHSAYTTDRDLAAQNGSAGQPFQVCIMSGLPSPAADFNGSDSSKCNNNDGGTAACYDVIP